MQDCDGRVKHLVLIDGHHLMYRAFYAIPATLRTSRGEQTNAVYGVASMLLSMLKIEEPDSILVCFDAGEETFRHQENATYKEGRAETPDEFYLQIPRILELFEAFSIQHVSDAAYEADDFLCAYARLAEKAGMRVTIVTGDRDAFQLAAENIRIAIPHKGYQKTEYLGPQEILTKFGVRPDQVPSFKGLTGDSSDNLPGVRGIGPKTASKLLATYGTLKNLYDHLEDVKPVTRQKLLADREQAFFCERMATLVCDLPIRLPLELLEIRTINLEPAFAFFREMEFSVLSKRLQGTLGTPYGKSHFLSDVKTPEVTAKKKEQQLSMFS